MPKKSVIVLCDGLNGMPSGDQAAKIISDEAMAAFLQGEGPSAVCVTANKKFREMQFDNVDFRRAGATICAVRIRDGKCEWANVGDSHIYHFSNGALANSPVIRHHPLARRRPLQGRVVRELRDHEALTSAHGPCNNISTT